jgi:CDP-diacylglycerol--glycerol-3-phosphate 3-phosphatidyltransferase
MRNWPGGKQLASLPELRHLLARYVTTPVVNVLSRTQVTPNSLTITGFLVSAGAAAAIAEGFFMVGGLLVLFAGLFDLLDGPLARTKGQVSQFGAILDSSLDRLSEAAVLLGVLIHFVSADHSWGPPLAYAALAGSFMVSYMRARAEGLGIDCEVGLFTRAERVVVLAVGLIVGEFTTDKAVLVALALLTALGFFTFLQRLVHVRQITRKSPGT